MLLTNPSAAGEPGVSSPKTCSRTPGANLDAQPAFVEYFVSLMRVRSSIALSITREYATLRRSTEARSVHQPPPYRGRRTVYDQHDKRRDCGAVKEVFGD